MKAAHELFVNRDLSAVEKYWSEEYIQHSPFVEDGRDALYQFAASVIVTGQPAVHYRFIGQGDIIAVHSEAPAFAVVLDFFRVANGKIVEHWDSIDIHGSPQVPVTPSGRTMVDGTTKIRDRDLTEQNAQLVNHYLNTVLVNGDRDQLGTFFREDGALIQHHKEIADGVAGLVAYLEAADTAGNPIQYVQVHRTIPEGNFVVTQSEVLVGIQLKNWMDIFRVEDGKIAEQWSVVMDVPPTSQNDNGVF